MDDYFLIITSQNETRTANNLKEEVMNIQEATKLAMERGKPIYRSSEFETFRKPGDNLELLPTNSYGYVVVKPRQKPSIHCGNQWQKTY